MRVFPAALERLTEQFAKLPGIGGKTAQRLAFYLLSQPQEEAEEFADALLEARRSVHLCPVCQNLTDRDICPICEDEERDHGLVCVVAEPKDVVAMERAREYHGVYHVLHGVISPLNQVGPDDLRIRELLERVGRGGVREVIMATNPDTEGEATAMYLSRLLRPLEVRVTRLAYGIPVGSQLEYADEVTLLRALEGRRDIWEKNAAIQPGTAAFFSIILWASALRSEEEQGQCAGAGVRADDRADVVDLDARDVQAAADLLRQEFRVCKAVTVADEDGLLFRLNGASLHAVDQREDGVFAAAGLRDVDEVAFVVHMKHGLDAERAADEGRCRRDAAAGASGRTDRRP